MYEKHGLMSKISNPVVLAYLRGNHSESHTRLIERALRKKLGITMEEKKTESKPRKRENYRSNSTPVKVLDPVLVDYLITQRKVHGASHRYTIENAILEMIAGEQKNERNSSKRD